MSMSLNEVTIFHRDGEFQVESANPFLDSAISEVFAKCMEASIEEVYQALLVICTRAGVDKLVLIFDQETVGESLVTRVELTKGSSSWVTVVDGQQPRGVSVEESEAYFGSTGDKVFAQFLIGVLSLLRKEATLSQLVVELGGDANNRSAISLASG